MKIQDQDLSAFNMQVGNVDRTATEEILKKLKDRKGYQQEIIDEMAEELSAEIDEKLVGHIEKAVEEERKSNVINTQENNCIYVLAGTHLQYTQWTKANNQTNCRYITGPNMLQGLYSFIYVSVGTYYNRTDVFDIDNMLMQRQAKRIIFADDQYEIPDEEREWR